MTHVLRFSWLAAIGFLASFCLNAQVGNFSTLENSSWQLIEIRSNLGSVQSPTKPERYLLRFRLNGRAQITADCNEAGATWSQEGNSLLLTELVTTRKLCVAPTLFNLYIMHLQNIQHADLGKQRLTLSTENEMVKLIFEPYTFTPTF